MGHADLATTAIDALGSPGRRSGAHELVLKGSAVRIRSSALGEDRRARAIRGRCAPGRSMPAPSVYVADMPSLQLLTAVHTRGVDGTADVARLLGVDEAQAEQQLREAERAGLVVKEHGDSVRVPIDYARGRLRLTAAGHVKKQTLEDERAE